MHLATFKKLILTFSNIYKIKIKRKQTKLLDSKFLSTYKVCKILEKKIKSKISLTNYNVPTT